MQNASSDCRISKRGYLEFREKIITPFVNSQKKVNNLMLWDALDSYCRGDICGYFQNGRYNIYTDREHFFAHGALILYDNFVNTFGEQINGEK